MPRINEIMPLEARVRRGEAFFTGVRKPISATNPYCHMYLENPIDSNKEIYLYHFEIVSDISGEVVYFAAPSSPGMQLPIYNADTGATNQSIAIIKSGSSAESTPLSGGSQLAFSHRVTNERAAKLDIPIIILPGFSYAARFHRPSQEGNVWFEVYWWEEEV